GLRCRTHTLPSPGYTLVPVSIPATDTAHLTTTPDRFHIWDKMMRKQMQEYLEVSWEMVKFMESDNAPVILKKSFDLQECMIDSLIQTESEITFLQKELEEVKLLEDEIAEVERETQEDTTVIIPSALYLAKLFHSVTKIDWDYNCDSTLIKGIHYGGEIAQPIIIDSSQHLKIFICDYLWSLNVHRMVTLKQITSLCSEEAVTQQ
ncbi:unnamed protein product, partial [Ranitomeya imitator]